MSKNKNSRPALRHMKDATPLERITAFYEHGPDYVKLNGFEEDKRLRMHRAQYMLIRSMLNAQIVRNLTMSFNVSKSTAYQDIRDAKILYQITDGWNKESDRIIFINKLLLAQQQCKKDNDNEGFARLLKIEATVKGYDRDEADLPDFSNLTPHVNEIGYFPDLLGVKPIANLAQVVASFMEKKAAKSITDAEIVKDDDSTE